MAVWARTAVGIPKYCPLIEFSKEGYTFIREHPDHDLAPVPYTASQVPKEAYMGTTHKVIPDFVVISGIRGMSREARDLVEEFEPGVHQFIPVNIVRKRGNKPIVRLDGRVLDEPYYLFNCMVWLDTILLDRSEVYKADIGNGVVTAYPDLTKPEARIVLNREMISGHHVWRGNLHFPERLFFSDQFATATLRKNLKKLEFTHYDEE